MFRQIDHAHALEILRLVHRAMLDAAVVALIVTLALLALTWLYRRVHQLESQVETLRTLLPICAHCKKIRVGPSGAGEQWIPVEEYFRRKDRVDFSHSVCGECLTSHYPDVPRREHP